MPPAEMILLEARLIKVIKEGVFCAELANGHSLVVHRAKPCGCAQRLEPGQTVRVRMSPYDMDNGSIVGEEEL